MQQYKIRISELAEQDLENAGDYIAFELLNPIAAENMVKGIREQINKLEVFPVDYELDDDPILAEVGVYKTYYKEYKNFILWQGKDKDYCIPTKDEIEYLYENGFYKPSKYDCAMIKFIEKICKNHNEAVMTEQIIQRMIYNDESLQDVIDLLEKNEIYFDNGISEFIMLFNNLWNNTRLIKNKGYTPMVYVLVEVAKNIRNAVERTGNL